MQQHYHQINDQLLESALAVSGLESEDEVINLALAQFLQMAKQRKLLELEGSIAWEGDLEQLRSARDFDGTH
jgi:Arc/MetJ family transcription regulator